MELFYIMTLVTAVATLTLLLVVLWVLMSYRTHQLAYPPKANTCPDYWTYNVDASSCVVNPKNQGNYTSPPTDPAVAPYAKGSNGSWSFSPLDARWGQGATSTLCAKRKWANDHHIAWDGVSNYTGNS